MRVPVYDAQGKRTPEILEFDEAIFGEEVRKVVLKEAILMYEARQRQGNHSTKTRKECSGTGRKMWRQKGTGRARVGPARAPHWKGGGVAFGPKPRDYSYSMPKKAKRAALDSAWLAKFQSKEICIWEGMEIKQPKTSEVNRVLKELGVATKRTVIAIPEYDQVLWKSVRNIPQVKLDHIANFNPYIIIHNQRVVLLRGAFEQLIKSRGGEIKSRDRKELYS